MTTPGEPYPDSGVEQLLAATLDQVRTAIGPDLAEAILPDGSTLLGVRTELYQSSSLEAGREVMPDQYPVDDRSLIMLALQNNQRVFLVGGRIDPTDPFDMDSALGGGVDARRIDRLVYAYDGGQTITEYLQDGNIFEYTGEYGDPATLLPYIRSRLGSWVATELAGEDPAAFA